MKRFFQGTFAFLAFGLAFVALDAHWPALFWMMVVSMGLYLLFGRKADVEFRIGLGGTKERRLYGAVVWKRQDRVPERGAAQEPSGAEASVAGRDG